MAKLRCHRLTRRLGYLCYTVRVNLDKILDLLRALARERVEYVLVGGVALNVHGVTRNTDDVDLFVRPTDENIERLRSALRAVWQDPAIDEITAEGLRGPYPTIRYGTPDEDIVVDVLARLGEAFQYDDLAVEVVDWEGIPVRLATPRTLYNMKRGTMRPQDRADAYQLSKKFGLEQE